MTVIDSTDRAIWISQNVLPHEPALRRWLAAQSADHIDVDDIVQESYAVVANLASVAHIHTPRAYLFEVARSIILQQLRRSRIVSIHSVADLAALDIAGDEPTPEDVAGARMELRELALAIAKLPPRCGEVFRLRKVDGLSQRETAAALGISENTVEKQIGKAIAIVSDLLGRGGKRPAKASIKKNNKKGRYAGPRDQLGD